MYSTIHLLHRAAGINYYEELGIADNASPEEIRDGFRALVRLLHPDHQIDGQLKIIAERQMQKLNRIYAVLSDLESRRRYDDSLEEMRSPPAIVFRPPSKANVQRLMPRFAWTGAALIAVATLIWLGWEGSAPVPVYNPVVYNPVPVYNVDASPSQKPLASPPAASADSQPDVAQLRSDLNAARTERDAAIHELMRLRGATARKYETAPATQPILPEHVASAAPVAMAVTELPPSPPVRPAPAKASPAPLRTFAGFWFYTRPGQGQRNGNTALYPPEFIQATLTEQGGLVHGRYRSRYQIVDRAISPDVNFEFTGTPNGSTMASSWAGSGGSKGELTLKITGDNSMEIEWSANQLGSNQGLVSGTAHLTKRLD
jgi:curved DNA-binding protein CbpA